MIAVIARRLIVPVGLTVVLAGSMLAIAPASGHAADRSKPFGLPSIQQQTPTSHAGVHPLLRWKSVPGAATYRVVVRDHKGKVAWAWSGPATRVVMSATTKPVGRRPGEPRLTPASTWTVAAFDAGGKPLALSASRAISP